MADESRIELQQAIRQELEAEGTISKLKADLRASIFARLKLKDRLSRPLSTEAHRRLEKLNSTTPNNEVLSLIHDALTSLGLVNTLKVFSTEANLDNRQVHTRGELQSSFGVRAQPDQAVLVDILYQSEQQPLRSDTVHTALPTLPTVHTSQHTSQRPTSALSGPGSNLSAPTTPTNKHVSYIRDGSPDFHRSQDNIPASLAAFEQDDAMHHLELSLKMIETAAANSSAFMTGGNDQPSSVASSVNESVAEDSFHHSFELRSGGSPLVPHLTDDEFRPARDMLQELASPVAASHPVVGLAGSNTTASTDVDLQRLEEIDRRLAELTARRASTESSLKGDVTPTPQAQPGSYDDDDFEPSDATVTHVISRLSQGSEIVSEDLSNLSQDYSHSFIGGRSDLSGLSLGSALTSDRSLHSNALDGYDFHETF